jgi:hypothetical protein
LQELSADDIKFYLQYEVALAIDAATVLRHALSNMTSLHPEIFRRGIHDGKVNGSESIDCDADPVKPWKFGADVMKFIRDVSKSMQTFESQFAYCTTRRSVCRILTVKSRKFFNFSVTTEAVIVISVELENERKSLAYGNRT